MYKLEIKNLSKNYGKVQAVDNLSIHVEKGTIYGFIGPNGAGKSTTLRCIMHAINFTQGEILFDNQPLLKNDVNIIRKIGYLPSDINLYDELSVKKMFDYASSFYEHDCQERIGELVKKLDIDINKKISKLSFGNLKKVGIVIALMHGPELLILDEPTSGLDPLMQNAFFEILKEEKKKGTTIIFSTHALEEIKKVCDIVSIIKQGKIVKTDTIKNLAHESSLIVSIISKNISDIKKSFDNEIIVHEDDDSIKMMFSKNINDLIKTLSKLKIEKLIIEEPSIEEIFMHYYDKE